MKFSTILWFVLLGCTVAAQQDTWHIRLDGAGPAKIGMSLVQLNAALHERFKMPSNKEDQGCFYLKPKTRNGIAFMIENGKLVRIDVEKPDIATDKGIGLGYSEDQVKRAYGPEIATEPSKYTGEEGGRYLTFRSADGQYGIRFETEKGRVTTFYAGTYETIQYVEGCE